MEKKNKDSRFFNNLHPLIRRKRKPKHEEDTHFAILNAIDMSLRDLEETTINSKIQSSLKTATGKYLEEFGDFLGVYRKEWDTKIERDSEFRERIIEALDIPRGTNDSIERAVRRYLEDQSIGVEVHEMWKSITRLNDPNTKLGSSKLQGEYYQFATIDVHVGTPFELSLVRLIEDYKPAGVKLHVTYDPNMYVVEGEYWGATPYPGYRADLFENTSEIFNSVYQPVEGTLKFSDAKPVRNIFKLNESILGSGEVLGGSYGAHSKEIHLARVGSDYTPSMKTYIDDVILKTKYVEEDFYTGRDKKDNNQYDVALRGTEQFYAIMNVGSAFDRRYPNLSRLKGDYETLMDKASVQLSFKAPRGRQIKLQAYDFKQKKWVDLGAAISGGNTEQIVGRLCKGKDFLNSQQLLFVRATVPRAMTLTINHFILRYSSDIIINEAGPKLTVMPSHPLFERDVSHASTTNMLNKAIVGYAIMNKNYGRPDINRGGEN